MAGVNLPCSGGTDRAGTGAQCHEMTNNYAIILPLMVANIALTS
jgi:hypothetical protein